MPDTESLQERKDEHLGWTIESKTKQMAADNMAAMTIWQHQGIHVARFVGDSLAARQPLYYPQEQFSQSRAFVTAPACSWLLLALAFWFFDSRLAFVFI